MVKKSETEIMLIKTKIDQYYGEIDYTRGPKYRKYIATPGVDDLVTLCPELLSEWDYEENASVDPRLFRPNSGKKVSWKCETCGHIWVAQICSRAMRGCGCGVCANRIIVRGINDLATVREDLLDEWNPDNTISPYEVSAGSCRKVKWICRDCGYKWEASIVDRTSNDAGCPHCNGRVAITGVDDLARLHPELMLEWDNEKNSLDPSMLREYSNKIAHWKCHVCGYEWKAPIKSRTSHGTGCPHCAGRVIIKGVDDFAFLHPNLMEEWDDDKNDKDPSTIGEGSHYMAAWRCKECGYEWQTEVRTRTRFGSGCPHCAEKVAVKGVDDLKSQYPELMKDWDYHSNNRDPETIRVHSGYMASWICDKCGHKWKATVADRTRGRGCPHCAKQVPEIGVDDFETLHPELMDEWNWTMNDKDPATLRECSGYYASWICKKCGHVWRATIYSRVMKGSGCPKCN